MKRCWMLDAGWRRLVVERFSAVVNVPLRGRKTALKRSTTNARCALGLVFCTQLGLGELVQPAGEPYRVELFPEPPERIVSDIGTHMQGMTAEWLFRAVNVADYGREAQNVNAFDEVPDSEWFVNRIERYALTPEQVARGPNQGDGPDPAGPWEIVGVKTTGLTPSLLIRDRTGARYFLKFDPVGHPELWTGAEIIGTRIVWAAGYHTPENFLVFFDDSILQPGPKVKLAPGELAELFRKISREPDGRIRAVASRFLPGKPKGPFLFAGTNPHDPNDVVDHRHRRELRGLTVLFAFLNNTDWKELNTLSMFVAEGERGYLKHYLLDFNQSLGAGGLGAKELWGGLEYYVDLKAIGWSHLTFGLRDRAGERARPSLFASVGNFESEQFNGRNWHPSRPVAPFLYFTVRDGFWAAKIVSCFTDEHIAAVVREARYSDPAAAAYVQRTLIERRDKIVRHWFRQFSPLRRLRVEGDWLTFEDMLVAGDWASAEAAAYRYGIGAGEWMTTRERSIPLPDGDRCEVQIEARYDGEGWQRPVRLKLRREAGGRWAVIELAR
jgi:hypothetical protein